MEKTGRPDHLKEIFLENARVVIDQLELDVDDGFVPQPALYPFIERKKNKEKSLKPSALATLFSGIKRGMPFIDKVGNSQFLRVDKETAAQMLWRVYITSRVYTVKFPLVGIDLKISDELLAAGVRQEGAYKEQTNLGL